MNAAIAEKTNTSIETLDHETVEEIAGGIAVIKLPLPPIPRGCLACGLIGYDPDFGLDQVIQSKTLAQ